VKHSGALQVFPFTVVAPDAYGVGVRGLGRALQGQSGLFFKVFFIRIEQQGGIIGLAACNSSLCLCQLCLAESASGESDARAGRARSSGIQQKSMSNNANKIV
jgi:hypothetical protein